MDVLRPLMSHPCLSPEDPQYMAQALTNVLLMDAVMGCLQNRKPIVAASKLAYFDKIIHEGLLFSLNTHKHLVILFIFIIAVK